MTEALEHFSQVLWMKVRRRRKQKSGLAVPCCQLSLVATKRCSLMSAVQRSGKKLRKRKGMKQGIVRSPNSDSLLDDLLREDDFLPPIPLSDNTADSRQVLPTTLTQVS
mmetsp:Transcript_25397/g.63708  ORF Transcript_25397/g.63708 Transcript_25397/m.63708 type:complete len:109 (+) Transcript_25397:66-392(+)